MLSPRADEDSRRDAVNIGLETIKKWTEKNKDKAKKVTGNKLTGTVGHALKWGTVLTIFLFHLPFQSSVRMIHLEHLKEGH